MNLAEEDGERPNAIKSAGLYMGFLDRLHTPACFEMMI